MSEEWNDLLRPSDTRELMWRFWGLPVNEFFNQSRAQEWIDEVCVRNNGKLDIDATAHKLQIPVFYEMPRYEDGTLNTNHGLTMGLINKTEELAVHINPINSPDAQALTYGHELGHIFLDKVANVPNPHIRIDKIEEFCEFFGWQVVMPMRELVDLDEVNPDTVLDLMEKFNAPHMTVIYQLMQAGKMPRRINFDSGIGEVPNPRYSGKVRRHTICLDCELSNPHDKAGPQDETPVYDFTHVDLSFKTSHCPCMSEVFLRDDEAFVALNRHYGRWTEADDAMTKEEAFHEAKRRRQLSDLAMRNSSKVTGI